MAELSTLARPYARAAFEYAREHSVVEPWAEQLAMVAAVVEEERMSAALDDPSLTASQQADILAQVCGDALANEARNFIGIVANNKRLPLLPEISAQFAQLKAGLEQSVDVEVVSAFDLADSARDLLAQALSRKLEREVNVTTRTDSELLGGVLVRAGDTVIDGSLRGRLNKLAEAMNS
jgi:F-type H+-transporting ATPase subunit delta